MPTRKVPLVNDHYYHIFNLGVARQPIFHDKRDYSRFLRTMDYYRYENPSPKFSTYIASIASEKPISGKGSKIIDLISYCLMPNHFHFLLKQNMDKGIIDFIRKLCNSYAKYFNVKSERIGPLFQGEFKSVLIETEEQLLHVQRYVHLNPYSSVVVNDVEENSKYPYSSLHEYVNPSKSDITNQDIIMHHFSDLYQYKSFIDDQADYQRTLNNIKHLTLE